MHRKVVHAAIYWAPPLIWGCGIFALSSMSNPPTPPPFPYSDKVAHYLLFAVLALLFRRAFEQNRGWMPIRASWAAFLLTVLYGALDEFHQSFVPNRNVEVADWIADVLGAATPFLTCLATRKDGKDSCPHEQSGSTTAN